MRLRLPLGMTRTPSKNGLQKKLMYDRGDGSLTEALPSCQEVRALTNAPSQFGSDDLGDDLGDDARAHRATALTDGEAELLLHGDRGDELDLDGRVVARHDHLDASAELHGAGHVGGAEVEL